MAPVTALQIDDLVKRYPTGTEALEGCRSTIEEGEFFGLLGPNGAGKSTLIHCTTGLAQPTRGDDPRLRPRRRSTTTSEARLAVGLAPQELNLDWFLTLEETLDYHGGYFGMPQARSASERTAELLDAFSLSDKRNDRTRTLSRRHEAPADPGPRADAPAAAADPRRADRRRRRRAAARAVALRPAHQRRGHDDPADHALPRRGRAALRPDRLHQRRRRSSRRARARELAAQYGVASLEDAYLELVGRKELSRAHVVGGRRRDRRRRSASSRWSGARSTAS